MIDAADCNITQAIIGFHSEKILTHTTIYDRGFRYLYIWTERSAAKWGPYEIPKTEVIYSCMGLYFFYYIHLLTAYCEHRNKNTITNKYSFKTLIRAWALSSFSCLQYDKMKSFSDTHTVNHTFRFMKFQNIHFLKSCFLCSRSV